MDSETVEVGTAWMDKETQNLVIVSYVVVEDGIEKVGFNYYDKQGKHITFASSWLELFLKTKEQLHTNSELHLKYSKGYTQGYKDCCDEVNAPRTERESILQGDAYDEGYKDAVMEMRGSERERVIREEAYDLGFMEALNTYGIELGEFELEPVSPYEFGAVEDEEPEYDFTEEIRKVLSGENKGVLRISKGTEPNKETQEAMQEVLSKPNNPTKEVKHSHYRKSVEGLDYIDIYRVCRLFGVEDNSHCLHHAIKKLLMSGKRGSKSKIKDITEARDSLNSYLSDEELFEGLDK